MKILVLNGPNINMLGIREPEHYGSQTYEDLKNLILENAGNDEIEFYQTNHEGCLVDAIQKAYFDGVNGIIFNPAAYTHTSVAICDAIAAISTPVVEVHISSILAREEFRHISMLAPVCRGSIMGFGLDSYRLGIEALKH